MEPQLKWASVPWWLFYELLALHHKWQGHHFRRLVYLGSRKLDLWQQFHHLPRKFVDDSSKMIAQTQFDMIFNNMGVREGGSLTPKLLCDRGAYGPAIVPTEENYWNLQNCCKIQTGVEISLTRCKPVTRKIGAMQVRLLQITCFFFYTPSAGDHIVTSLVVPSPK